jgi:hypothetical protein
MKYEFRDPINQKLAQTYLRMLKEEHKLTGEEAAASHIHDEWMKRNPKADYNADQHVPYQDLPEHEKEKDRLHVHTAGSLIRNLPKRDEESTVEHHERVADRFGSIAHEEWRKGHEASKGAGVARMKKVSDGGEVNINVPWKDLHPEWKKENLEAGRAAVAATVKHMSHLYESHTAKEIAGTPTAELRKLAKTYERSASDRGVEHDAAIEAGNKDKAAMLKKKMLDHTDEAMDIRTEIRKRLGIK